MRSDLRRARRAAPVLVLLVALLTLVAPLAASAHAELRQSSPQAGETVGGAVHSIALQFFGLDLRQDQVAAVYDSAGNELQSQLNIQDERLVLALVDPITTPDEYLVTYTVHGVDGDTTDESFTFTWQDGAPAPAGITVDLTEPVGFDTINYVLLLVGAAIAAFLAHRLWMAWREHQAAASIPAGEDGRP